MCMSCWCFSGLVAADLYASLNAVVDSRHLEVLHQGAAKQFDQGYCIIGVVFMEHAKAEGVAIKISCKQRNTAEGSAYI